MEDRLNLAPTKSNLLALRQQVVFLDEGYQLLERKREMLTRLVYSKLREYQALKNSAHQSLREAYRNLSITQMRMGTPRIRQLALGMPPAIEANILPRRNMGVQYPSVDISPKPLLPVGILGTDVSLDKTRKNFAEMAVQMAKLAELESALWRLLEEQRKTQKRVNALKYNIIPRYQRSISFIENTLEEEERDALFQLKVLQQQA